MTSGNDAGPITSIRRHFSSDIRGYCRYHRKRLQRTTRIRPISGQQASPIVCRGHPQIDISPQHAWPLHIRNVCGFKLDCEYPSTQPYFHRLASCGNFCAETVHHMSRSHTPYLRYGLTAGSSRHTMSWLTKPRDELVSLRFATLKGLSTAELKECALQPSNHAFAIILERE